MKLDELRQIEQAATPGPWAYTGSDLVRRRFPGEVVEGEVIDRELHWHVQTWHNGTLADATFVCAARNTFALLLDVAEAARALAADFPRDMGGFLDVGSKPLVDALAALEAADV